MSSKHVPKNMRAPVAHVVCLEEPEDMLLCAVTYRDHSGLIQYFGIPLNELRELEDEINSRKAKDE